MKNWLILLLFPFLFSCFTQQKDISQMDTSTSMVEIFEFQQKLIEEWNNPESTPLKEEEKENFQGISFFPMDLKYKVKANFLPIKDGKTFPFPTSAQTIKYYKEFGKIKFQLNGAKHELTIYQSDPPIEGYEEFLFLPFMDETNGETTYGGGRYLDLEISDIQSGNVWIDFNKAYNPYCAYSSYYSCPIPPSNNYLNTEVKSGVSYHP